MLPALSAGRCCHCTCHGRGRPTELCLLLLNNAVSLRTVLLPSTQALLCVHGAVQAQADLVRQPGHCGGLDRSAHAHRAGVGQNCRSSLGRPVAFWSPQFFAGRPGVCASPPRLPARMHPPACFCLQTSAAQTTRCCPPPSLAWQGMLRRGLQLEALKEFILRQDGEGLACLKGRLWQVTRRWHLCAFERARGVELATPLQCVIAGIC